MKPFLILILVCISSSCLGRKNTIQKTSYPNNTTKTNISNSKTDSTAFKLVESNKTIIISKNDTIKSFNKNAVQNIANKLPQTHQLWNSLLQKYVTNNGTVNYKSFKAEHKKLHNYIGNLNLVFSSEDFKTFSKNELLAFWINAYNAMTIDLILRHYPINSIKEIEKPWDLRLWKLDEKWYNLNDIEHRILRKMDEPRIHFAIVCASVSCPKLLNKAFKASILDKQLTKSTKDFLNDNTKNNISQDNLELSKIFQWFAKDFKQKGHLIDFLNLYSDTTISSKAKKSYKTYDWNLNE